MCRARGVRGRGRPARSGTSRGPESSLGAGAPRSRLVHRLCVPAPGHRRPGISRSTHLSPRVERTGHTWVTSASTSSSSARARVVGSFTRARQQGHHVLLLELGPHVTAADLAPRWEAKATHDLWWPIRFALVDGGPAARCHCSAAIRVLDDDGQHQSHLVTGRVRRRWTTRPPAASAPDVQGPDPHYEAVESACGVRKRGRLAQEHACIRQAPSAARAVCPYTDADSRELRSVPAGCPNKCGKSTLMIRDASALLRPARLPAPTPGSSR